MKILGKYVLAIAILLSLVACGGNNNTTENLEKQTEAAASTNKIEATPIKLGETINLEFVEMSLDALEVADKYDFYYEEDGSSSISYSQSISLEPSAGLKLVSLHGTFKNKTTESVYSGNNIVYATFTINGNKYNSQFQTYNVKQAEPVLGIAAQQSCDYYLYAEVPPEVADNIEKCEIYFGYEENFTDSYKVSSTEDLDYLYYLDAMPTKKEA